MEVGDVVGATVVGEGVGEAVVGEGVAGIPLQMAKPVRVTEPSVRHEMVEPADTYTPVGALVPM